MTTKTPSIFDITPDGKKSPANKDAKTNAGGLIPPDADFAEAFLNQNGVEVVPELFDALEKEGFMDNWNWDSDGNGMTTLGDPVNELQDVGAEVFSELVTAFAGTVGGQTILNPEWVSASANPWIQESNRLYGLWWRERSWKNYPSDDSYLAWGHGGQFLFVFPSADLIVVVTSKWTVPAVESYANVKKVFSYVDNQILTPIEK